MSNLQKPIAIFICGPVAAGKSSTVKWYEKVGYEQGIVMNFDTIFKSQYDRLRIENKAVPESNIKILADNSALAAREAIFNSCIENKLSFSYENTLTTWKGVGMRNVFEKMEEAKKNGFEVRTYVTFQNSLDGHLKTEKKRRNESKEIGAFFKTNAEAKEGVIISYQNCLKGMSEALKHSDSMKVYINYMTGDPESNRPKLVAQYQNGEIGNVKDKCTNPDVKKALDSINKNIELSKGNKIEEPRVSYIRKTKDKGMSM